jgi:hypothetical protein
MKKRDFTITIILILAAAIFAGNFDEGATGKLSIVAGGASGGPAGGGLLERVPIKNFQHQTWIVKILFV